MDITNFTDHKNFWKNVNPIFSNKSKMQDKIMLVEDNQIITEDGQIAEIMNMFYKNAVENLAIEQNIGFEQSIEGIEDSIEAAIHKFEYHPSIIKIKEKVKDINRQPFNFSKVDDEQINKEIHNLNVRKAATYKNIPAKILKKTIDICTPILKYILNSAFENDEFPNDLKLADVSSVFKREDSTKN